MSDNNQNGPVVELTDTRTVNPEIVEMLEEITEAARGGYIIGVAVATVNYDNNTGNSFGGERIMLLTAETAMLLRELQDQIDTRCHKGGELY